MVLKIINIDFYWYLALIVVVFFLINLTLYSPFVQLPALHNLSRFSPTGTLYIKIFRDFLVFSFIGLLFLRITLSKRQYALLFLLTLNALVSIFTSSMSPVKFLCGIKWFVPFLVVTLPITLPLTNARAKASSIFQGLFYAHLGLQILQLFLADGAFGTIANLFNARNTGLLLFPSAGALFSLSCFLLISRNIFFHMVLLILSIGLTASLAGYGTLFLLILYYYLIEKKFSLKQILVLVFLFLLFGIFIHYSRIAGGSNYLAVTIAGRISSTQTGHFSLDEISSLQNIFGNFGLYTNSFSNINPAAGIISDSIYKGIIGNLGIVGLTLFLVSFYLNHKRSKYPILIVFLTMSFAQNTPESLPMIAFLLLLLKENKEELA